MKIPEGYFAILFREHSSGTIAVKFPDHPGVVTYGKDWSHAEIMAHEALNSALESEFERGVELPVFRNHRPGKHERAVFVAVSPQVRTAYLLRDWRKVVGLSQKEIAKRLGISYQAYQRMERPGRSNLTVVTLEKIAKALDGVLVLEMKFPRRRTRAA